MIILLVLRISRVTYIHVCAHYIAYEELELVSYFARHP